MSHSPHRPAKLAPFLLLAVLTLACAGPTYSVTGYTADVATWVGQDANTLVRTWGPPASTFLMPNGDTTYVYVDKTDIPTDKQLTCSYNQETHQDVCTISGGETLHLGCTTSFEVGPDQRVAFTRVEGTLCLVAMTPPSGPAFALPTGGAPLPAAPPILATPLPDVAETSVAPGEPAAAQPATLAPPVEEAPSATVETPDDRRRGKRKNGAHP